MEALLLRMAPGDSEAETALRIIAYFDRLVEHAGDMGDLLRSAARLVRAPAGYSDPAGQDAMSFTPAGRSAGTRLPAGAATKALAADAGPAGLLWLGPEADPRVMALVLERMAISATVILGRAGGGAVPVPVTWVSQLLAGDLDAGGREEAARGLGLHPQTPARVVVMTGDGGAAALTGFARAWCVTRADTFLPCAEHDGHTLTVVQAPSATMPASPPRGRLLATGATLPVAALASSMRTALIALRLTSSWLGPQVVSYDALGPLRHIAEVDPGDAADSFEVAQLRHLSQTEAGLGGIKALEAFCRHGSLRTAAAELHLHHSSLAHRLATISGRLHLSLDTPDGRLRARLALHLYRIAEWSPTPQPLAAPAETPGSVEP